MRRVLARLNRATAERLARVRQQGAATTTTATTSAASAPAMQQAPANGGGSSVLAGEDTLLDVAFGSDLDPRLHWVRPAPEGQRTDAAAGALVLSTLPGGIWGSFFDERLARNFLLAPQSAFVAPATTTAVEGGGGGGGINAVEATVALAPRSWGEQAGLFWYGDDRNYAKFVVEGMKDGSAALVFALEVGGTPRVVSKLPWADVAAMAVAPTSSNGGDGGGGGGGGGDAGQGDAAPTPPAITLRLELKPDLSLSACVVHPRGWYMRHVASVSVAQAAAAATETAGASGNDDGGGGGGAAGAASSWVRDPAVARQASVGIGAHGGAADASPQGEAHFSTLRLLSVRTDRLDFRPGGVARPAAAAVATHKAAPAETAPPAADGDGGVAATAPAPSIEQVGGWRISADMSPEQRQRVMALIGGLSGGGEVVTTAVASTATAEEPAARVEQVGGWRISADLSPERRERMLALIGMSAGGVDATSEAAAPAAAAVAAAAAAAAAASDAGEVEKATALPSPLESLTPEYDEATGAVRWRNPFAGRDLQAEAATSADAAEDDARSTWHVSPHLQGEQRARIMALLGQQGPVPAGGAGSSAGAEVRASDGDEGSGEAAAAAAALAAKTQPLVGTWRVSASASPELQQRILELLHGTDLVPGGAGDGAAGAQGTAAAAAAAVEEAPAKLAAAAE